MNSSDAAALVNRTIFRPGWKFSASYASATSIDVTFWLDTVDTSYPDSAGAYDVPKLIDQTVTIDVPGLGEHTLLALLLRYAHKMDDHEDREFLRVRQPDGTWKAPFHPHNDDGELAWLLAEAGLFAQGARP